MNIQSALKTIQTGKTLNEDEMIVCMQQIMAGQATDGQLGAFLMGLSQRGETAEEIIGAARVLRDKASTITAPGNAVDCCGTGGDGLGTYNVSTAVALVCAACGVPVAKHGNRASSSKSGAADVLEALGVNLDVPHDRLATTLEEMNFCFLMAPQHHSAMKHVVPVRKQLGFRTIFNLLGPLANPAGTKNQLIGVYSRKWLIPMAEALRALGTEKAWIVHGQDGLDEITVTAPTDIAILDNGNITEETIHPDDFGLPVHTADELTGGDAAENAGALLSLLQGKKNAYRDIVLANAAAVLCIHNGENDLKTAALKAAQAIDTGATLRLLEQYKDAVKP